MPKRREIAPVVRKKPLSEPDRDVRYWRRRTVAARVAQVEKLRRRYILWRYGSYPPIARVVRIVSLHESRGTWFDEQVQENGNPEGAEKTPDE